jgi:hypothetical protein
MAEGVLKLKDFRPCVQFGSAVAFGEAGLEAESKLGFSRRAKIMNNGIKNKGLWVRELNPGEMLSMTTRNRSYWLTYLGDGKGLLSGHPTYCQKPTPVRIEGSTWGGSAIESNFLGEGMHVEFVMPDGQTMTTSTVFEIKREPVTMPLAA